MTTRDYQELISDGVQGLPSDVLAEIVDFIYFVRKRAAEPRVFEEELRNGLARAEMKRLSRDSEAHLDMEFDGYEQRYPRE